MSDRGDGEQTKIRDICSKARKIVGFTPIEPRMLEIQKNSYGAKDNEEAMLMEIKSYWKCEMKVKPSDIEKMKIVRIFPPAKEDWDTLYVEFENEFDVDKMFRYTRIMCKPDHRLKRWIPKELFERYRTLEYITYTRRESMKDKGIKLKTRVKVGRDDLDLSVKFPNSGWKSEPLPHGLPDIDIHAVGGPAITLSPPPGRPDRPQRKRPLSSGGSQDHLKRLREGRDKENLEDNTKGSSSTNKEVDMLNLDLGQFTNTEGYSPATPAKVRSIPDLSVVINSPVFHNKAKNIQ